MTGVFRLFEVVENEEGWGGFCGSIARLMRHFGDGESGCACAAANLLRGERGSELAEEMGAAGERGSGRNAGTHGLGLRKRDHGECAHRGKRRRGIFEKSTGFLVGLEATTR